MWKCSETSRLRPGQGEFSSRGCSVTLPGGCQPLVTLMVPAWQGLVIGFPWLCPESRILSELRPRIRERTGAAPWGVSGRGSRRRPWLQDILGGGRGRIRPHMCFSAHDTPTPVLLCAGSSGSAGPALRAGTTGPRDLWLSSPVWHQSAWHYEAGSVHISIPIIQVKKRGPPSHQPLIDFPGPCPRPPVTWEGQRPRLGSECAP